MVTGMKSWVGFWVLWILSTLGGWAGEPLPLRVVAANLTSDNRQTYSPDNANHSNPEGAGARILKGLKPDVVLIQEFNTTVPVRQWVNATFGEGFAFAREAQAGNGPIPNGVVSRYPIVASGSWDDPVLDNREFFWARIALPGGRELWAVSLHWHSKSATSRSREAVVLAERLRQEVPKGALLVVGGDLNTRSENEPCFDVLRRVVVVPGRPPVDGFGIPGTNAPRNRPYDWVLAGESLEKFAVPVKIGGKEYRSGLVFDSRAFELLDAVAPVRRGDSGLPMMQHMAVVRDFLVVEPSAGGETKQAVEPKGEKEANDEKAGQDAKEEAAGGGQAASGDV